MGEVRIVAGTYGGRWIEVPPGGRVRPTREMVREAWFNALGGAFEDARAVDLFAGSGALGIEALSRGAHSVTFVESDRRSASVVRGNLEKLGVLAKGRVVRGDVRAFLRGLSPSERFDLALADPPYDSEWPARLAEMLHEGRFARLLCVEHRPGALAEADGVVWSREYGDTALTFLRPGEEADGTSPGREEEPR